MRVLALETSGTSGSVAVLDDARTLAERSLPAGQRSAQSLAPAIDALLREIGWQPGDLKLVAVTAGPGSFTGLRIGVTTAKALAYAVDCPLIGVNTLEVVARQAPAQLNELHAVLDAQRDELFAAQFVRTAAGAWTTESATHLVRTDDWLGQLHRGAAVTGPGLKRLVDRLPAGVMTVDPAQWQPMASTVGQIGYEQFAAGRRDDVFQLVPSYFRRTAAEEQWDRRHGPAQ